MSGALLAVGSGSLSLEDLAHKLHVGVRLEALLAVNWLSCFRLFVKSIHTVCLSVRSWEKEHHLDREAGLEAIRSRMPRCV